jgi:chorismate mutase
VCEGRGVLNQESVASILFTVAERDVAAIVAAEKKRRERGRERERVLCGVFRC